VGEPPPVRACVHPMILRVGLMGGLTREEVSESGSRRLSLCCG
jgi:hypothetical protein